MLRSICVVPDGAWVYYESVNRTGRPAVHELNLSRPGYTLCGRNAEGWMFADGDANCKLCLTAKRKQAQPGGED